MSFFSTFPTQETLSFAYSLQSSNNADEVLPLPSFVLHGRFRAVKIPDKVKPFRNGPPKFINTPTDVTRDLPS